MKNKRIDLQFFAEETTADLLNYLGIEQQSSSQTDNSGDQQDDSQTKDEGTTSTEGQQNNQGTQTDEGKQQADSTAQKDEGAKNNSDAEAKKEFAFAQLRAENSKNRQILTGLQKLLNIPEDTAIDDVLIKVQESVVKAQAKQTGVPEEILKEINTLKQRDQEFQTYQLKENALLGFNKIQKDYALTQEQVKGFATELLQSGLNPFEKSIDINKEYVERHLDDIIKSRVDAGIKSEQERAAKASSQGSKPNATQGQTKDGQSKINSIKELDAWLTENKK